MHVLYVDYKGQSIQNSVDCYFLIKNNITIVFPISNWTDLKKHTQTNNSLQTNWIAFIYLGKYKHVIKFKVKCAISLKKSKAGVHMRL